MEIITLYGVNSQRVILKPQLKTGIFTLFSEHFASNLPCMYVFLIYGNAQVAIYLKR